MIYLLDFTNRFICGIPVLIFILGVGIYLSWKTQFAQFRFFPKACKRFAKQFTDKRNDTDGVTPYQALCTALAATVGTGNMAGVAGAIAIGGPGAVFWMWVSAGFGMAVKYAEAILSVRYRIKNHESEYIGGPMYMIREGLGEQYRWLAGTYCFFGVIASFGVGNATQVNTVIASINNTISVYGGEESLFRNCIFGIIFVIIVGIMLTGGIKRIGRIAELLVPVASVFYIIICTGVLILHSDAISGAFTSILTGAFSPAAVTGGAVGSAFQALRVGVTRGVFTNEAGLGTASIAHASANVNHPTDQGLMGIIEVFLDTIVICTMTALAILCSGVQIPYGTDAGITVANAAFTQVYGGWICIPITISLSLFAVATILGWGLYGRRCIQYLFGNRAWKPYVVLQLIAVLLGACMQTGTVWIVTEIVNSLMAIPNLIALTALTPELLRLVDESTAIRKTRKQGV